MKELEKHVVFKTATLTSIIESNPAYAKLVCQRLKKAGNIIEIERGKYTVHDDAFLISSRIVWPSYISTWSALRYHNLTEQVPHAVWVVTTKKRKCSEIRFNDTTIFFIRTKPKNLFGYSKVEYNGFEVFIADPEKAIVDSLLFKKISVSETYDVLENHIESINVYRLAAYAIQTGNGALIKRLGYMLDRLNIDLHKKLRKYIYPTPVVLEYNLPVRGNTCSKWALIENAIL